MGTPNAKKSCNRGIKKVNKKIHFKVSCLQRNTEKGKGSFKLQRKEYTIRESIDIVNQYIYKGFKIVFQK